MKKSKTAINIEKLEERAKKLDKKIALQERSIKHKKKKIDNGE